MNAHVQDKFFAQLTAYFDAVFESYANGLDVSPGDSLRLEGFMQAGLVLGLAEGPELVDLMARRYELAFSRPMPDIFPEANFTTGVIPVPAAMCRAPVWPSTKD
ncbi:MAG: hypothetical protein V7711_10890 [Pseudomonadales bacterium]